MRDPSWKVKCGRHELLARPRRAPDLLHVAYASELAAEIFISFDEEQLALAKATGLKVVCPG
jgi:hypothetical protein